MHRSAYILLAGLLGWAACWLMTTDESPFAPSQVSAAGFSEYSPLPARRETTAAEKPAEADRPADAPAANPATAKTTAAAPPAADAPTVKSASVLGPIGTPLSPVISNIPTIPLAHPPSNGLKPAAQVFVHKPTVAAPAAQPIAEDDLKWHADYDEAMIEAMQKKKMLLIVFQDMRYTAANAAFDKQTLGDTNIKRQLQRYVLAKLPVTAETKFSGKPVTLLRHPSFAEMLGRQGVAIVDLAHAGKEYYGYVVSTFPFTPGKYYRFQALSIILDLPPGTLTQRTMIYAVRTHPEAPASTQGVQHPALAEEAKSHSAHQAAITLQGHHSWEMRFHRINSKLPGGAMAQEVVAESWPNESLVDACVDCVASWRQSPGHWSAVRSRQPLFGFDIKRGRNGIWYATGIFGRR